MGSINSRVFAGIVEDLYTASAMLWWNAVRLFNHHLALGLGVFGGSGGLSK